MAYDFSIFNRSDRHLDEAYVKWLIENESLCRAIQFERLWSYYQNDSSPSTNNNSSTARPYLQAQEYGLPPRITGLHRSYWGSVDSGVDDTELQRKEIVIENDIGWRIETIVDFLFGRSFTITSNSPDKKRANEIEQILNAAFEANGGIIFFQQLALLGSVYGFVDILFRADSLFEPDQADCHRSELNNIEYAVESAKQIILEAIEPVRSLPVLNENDYRIIDFYLQYYIKQHNDLAPAPDATINSSGSSVKPRQSKCLEVFSDEFYQRYEDDELIFEAPNPLKVLPVVHIQNMAVPYQYEGHSDVEPLIPLQDELNTRLSDRASRITFQSFKMYLGKGVDNFLKLPVAPGVMWNTDNPEASIQEFGGDDGSPAETEHILQVRDALEKTSGVAAIAAGIIRNRIGNLTSAVALKITLMGILAKNQRKRQCYGRAIKEIANLVLLALDRSNIYPNRPEERTINIHWPNPLPENVTEILQEAKLKLDLGVSPEQVLNEIGY